MDHFSLKALRYRLLALAPVMALFCHGPLLLSCIGERNEPPSSVEKSTSESDKLSEPAEISELLSAGLVGSKHDFTQTGDRPIDLCTACHTPHLPFVKTTNDRGELAGRIRPYQAYGVELDSASLLCLSCHDGVTASDVFTSAHSTQFSSQLGSSRLGSGTLSGHPIGVKYPVSDPTYRPINSVQAEGRINLPNERVQCISCHDPHNTGRYKGMLVQSNSGSRLCLSCHRL